MLPKEIILLDLFSGTGGFAKGFLEAGFTIKEHYYSEIDKNAIANYEYNFKEAKNLGDVAKINGNKIPRPHILTFGSPCQDVSLAGKRKGINGQRSKLFFEAVRLIRQCRPTVFIFENVKGLYSSNKGKDFEAVLKSFADLGLYDIQWQLLNTRWFLPQNRERIYIVGHLREKSGRQIFPLNQSHPGDHQTTQTQAKPKEIISTIDTQVGSSSYRSPHIIEGTTHLSRNYKRQVEFLNSITANHLITEKAQNPVSLKELTSNNSQDKRVYQAENGLARTLKSNGGSMGGKTGLYKIENQIRRLTPVECERLQGFPDNWTRYGIFSKELKEISDTQRYHLLGNAVSVPVVKAIALKILNQNNTPMHQTHLPLNGIENKKKEVQKAKMKTPITYYGGKQTLLNQLLPLVPTHNVYCEPFFGGGALFFAKPASEVEVINDINGEVINFFKVIKHNFPALKKEIQATLFSRDLYKQAMIIYKHPEMFSEVKRAWAFWTATNQGFSSKIGSWGFGNDNSKEKVLWQKREAFESTYTERLKQVQIENKDALEVIQRCDTINSFFYCDPPYLSTHMGHYKGYTEEQYISLLDKLASLKGKFLLSSYPSKVLSAYIKKNKWRVEKIQKRVTVTKNTEKIKTELLVYNYEPPFEDADLKGINKPENVEPILKIPEYKILSNFLSWHNREVHKWMVENLIEEIEFAFGGKTIKETSPVFEDIVFVLIKLRELQEQIKDGGKVQLSVPIRLRVIAARLILIKVHKVI